jgi:hypothetical protein
VSEVAVSDSAHELLERLAAHLDEALVIIALEVDLRLRYQAVINDGLKAVGRADRGTAPGVQSRNTIAISFSVASSAGR